MLETKQKEPPKTRKVMMLWDEVMYKAAKQLALDADISVSELSRIAIQKVLDDNK